MHDQKDLIKYQIRYLKPSRFDKAKMGTVCKIINDPENEIPAQIYVQLSPNEDIPSWQLIGTLLENAFKPILLNEDFLKFCIDMFIENLNSENDFSNEHNNKFQEILSFIRKI